jgi:hypothetical protein
MGEAIKKGRKSKCSMCENLFEKEELTVKGSKKYCANCLRIREEEIKKNKSDWDILFDYICKLYKINKPTGMMFRQLKEFRGEEYNYTNTGMYYTLKYYYEVLENDVLEGTGLGIMPYFYDKARQHYNKVYDLENIVDTFENTEQIIKIKTKISSKDFIQKEPLPLNIDWEEINEGD